MCLRIEAAAAAVESRRRWYEQEDNVLVREPLLSFRFIVGRRLWLLWLWLLLLVEL